MIQCVIIADDLTGANATGVMLKKLNLKTMALMNLEKVDLEGLNSYDVISYSIDSRSIDRDFAYQRVLEVVKLIKKPGIRLYNKRIDSTLRGNLGAEIDGMLDGLGDHRVAIVVPAFPQAGRIAVGGYLLVNGMMLQKTDAAKDPRNPIKTSVIETLVSEQTRYKVRSIYLDAVYSDVSELTKTIQEAYEDGNRIIIVDALQIEDLTIIAEAVLRTGIGFITVDPGPFTAAVAGKLIALENKMSEDKILMSIGSVSNLTKLQLEEVQRAFKLFMVEISSEKLIDADKREEEMDRVTREILSQKEGFNLFCVVTDGIYPENRIDFPKLSNSINVPEEEINERLNDGIAEITHRILGAAPEFQGIFSSGGDITVAICRRFHASGMSLLQEIIPLAAYGMLEGGDYHGLKTVTKGGMVGDKDGMKICIQFLKEQLSVK